MLERLKEVRIPAANALTHTDAMAIYQALQPFMPAPQNGLCQRATRLIDILTEFDGLILDGHGVVNLGNEPIDGIAELLDAAAGMAKPVLILTNGASLPSTRAFAKYQKWRLQIACDDVLSSRDALVGQLEDSLQIQLMSKERIGVFGRSIETLVGSQFMTYGRNDNFWQIGDAFVFLGGVDWNEADQAAFERAMQECPRPLHVANPDVTAPQANGKFSAEPGYWTARMMQRLAKREIPMEVNWYGKPYRPAFDMALNRMKIRLGGTIDHKRIAMVGDSLHTDILGAGSAGMTTVLITDHGLFQNGTALAYCEACGIHPDWIVDTL